MTQSVDSIFDSFGGPSQFGLALGISRKHAATMKTRGSIPPEYWERLVAEAAARGIAGITLEALAKIAAARKRPETVAQGEAVA